MYKPRWFETHELVYPLIWAARGDRALELMDERILITADQLRDKFGKITVNNYEWGGQYKESGLRSFTTQTGAKLSQHRFGRGLDMKFGQTTPQEVYDYILNSPEDFEYITCVENIEATKTWLHIDCRTLQTGGIRVINP